MRQLLSIPVLRILLSASALLQSSPWSLLLSATGPHPVDASRGTHVNFQLPMKHHHLAALPLLFLSTTNISTTTLNSIWAAASPSDDENSLTREEDDIDKNYGTGNPLDTTEKSDRDEQNEQNHNDNQDSLGKYSDGTEISHDNARKSRSHQQNHEKEKGNEKEKEKDDEQVMEKTTPKRVTLIGLEDIINLDRSGIVGLGTSSPTTTSSSSSFPSAENNDNNIPSRLNYEQLHASDLIEDSIYDPFSPDASCLEGNDDDDDVNAGDCWHPPDSTVEEEFVRVWRTDVENEGAEERGGGKSSAGLENLAWGYGGVDPDDEETKEKKQQECNNLNGEGDNDELNGGNNDIKGGQCKQSADSTSSNELKIDEKQSSLPKSPATPPRKGTSTTILVDKHWGSDVNILRMRDRLRGRRGKYWDWIEEQASSGTQASNATSNATVADESLQKEYQSTRHPNISDEKTTSKFKQSNSKQRPPVFLMPGLASTRLVSWKHKPCPQNPLLSDIKMLDYVWLNMNILIQMATIDVRCFSECMTLGKYQTDYDGAEEEYDFDHSQRVSTSSKTNVNSNGINSTKTLKIEGCKLRPDEGLDAISSLAPGSFSSDLLVGGTNTVYAWLIQWLADNLGYDVTSIVALPYDWRLSPDKMEQRDGFLTLVRMKIEAAVKSNGLPGIMVAHSMGNSVFRYFLEWLRVQMREEVYERYVRRAKQRAAARSAAGMEDVDGGGDSAMRNGGVGVFGRGRAFVDDWFRYYLPGGAERIAEGEKVDDSSEDNLVDELSGPFDYKNVEIDRSENSEDNENLNWRDADELLLGAYPNEQKREYPKLWELAKMEGDSEWIDWQGKHIWTYVGLAAPLLGAPGPLRAVLSGENMGLPFTDAEARVLELSFGSTSTVNTISTKMGFCDLNDDDAGNRKRKSSAPVKKQNRSDLACLDELVAGIEASGKANKNRDPWKNYPALRLLLKDRVDFDSAYPMVRVEKEICEDGDKSCNNEIVDFGADDVMNGHIFDQFSRIWREKGDPMSVKLEQLRSSWWETSIPNPLVSTPDRPHIKHVIMAYGVDVPTEAGFGYKKIQRYRPKRANDNSLNNATVSIATTNIEDVEEHDGVPEMSYVIWEEKNGELFQESKLSEPLSFKESLLGKKKPKKIPFNHNGKGPQLNHSGDGTIPYLSLMWSHTWLLHATRAMRSLNHTLPFSQGERISDDNALDSIKVSHRPKGGNEWLDGYGKTDDDVTFESKSNIGDTGTSHPHGTKYKPKMVRFQSSGKSRSTGMEYTTTVIEAIGVEHKETTRNYDILAAAFTDVLKNLHDDYGLV